MKLNLGKLLGRTAKALFRAAKPVIVGAVVSTAASKAQAGIDRLTKKP